MTDETRSPSIFWILAGLVLPPAGVLWNIEVEGELPKDGPFILAPNHNSEVDPVIVGIGTWKLGRAPRFMAKESLFRIPLFGRLLRASGQIPVSRGPGKGNRSALDAADVLAKTGGGVIVYPEGSLTREPDLWAMRGKSGAIRLALATGIPVYPCAQWGAQQVMPRYGRIRPTFRARIRMVVGEPLDLTPYQDRRTSASALAEATELLMQRINGLLGELRGATPPATSYNPLEHGQSEHGRTA
ncbi:1-acyl-sn-glycerol-3-phosphate acyltransferase [Pseudoclavibacter endophyticus]|uniref:1-acyl-sn-glycerol-3-phosphate acyltransferase n=1 Tax=Pseudoclavibacter endophyticus TaxID=1778590 RepID=A0A6H9WQP6_9MICO|nr:lysophospholipid acyltransferase family protein [Pseudoclavibacter endophyticus]KAB1649287.1 1-acyl-sn-glycerol-3-phosphate acyltransferase [Pseudoclavibacter endophyticus]GGA63846.1 1-acyl-sn-glycerol-3-phosphate acyltransferase [Pseudoclavibacter endophyticus]